MPSRKRYPKTQYTHLRHKDAEAILLSDRAKCIVTVMYDGAIIWTLLGGPLQRAEWHRRAVRDRLGRKRGMEGFGMLR